MPASTLWGNTVTSRSSPSPTATATTKKAKKSTERTNLSDDELRRRILANAAVLFPSSSTQRDAYEIVYGTRPRCVSSTAPDGEDNPWQYAMLLRCSPSGEYTPLMRGQAWSTSVPWSMALQGLLDATAAAIHKKLGVREMPLPGMIEELPRYSDAVSCTVTQ